MALATWSWYSDRYTLVDETLTVDDSGGLWLWSPAPEVESARVGTFGFRLDDAERAGIADVARQVAASADTGGHARGGIEISVQAGGVTRVLSTAQALPPPLEEARAVGEALRERARHAPLAVARLGWHVAPAPPATLAVTVCNDGTEAIQVLFVPESVRILTATEEGWEEAWRAGPGHAGLMGPDFVHLGGMTTPAELEPGVTGTAAFPGALEGIAPGTDVVVTARAHVTLLRASGPDDFPEATAQFTTAPAPLR